MKEKEFKSIVKRMMYPWLYEATGIVRTPQLLGMELVPYTFPMSVAYDINYLLRAIKVLKEGNKAITLGTLNEYIKISVKAMIGIKKTEKGCHGAFEVKYAAGSEDVDKVGKLVYGMGYYMSKLYGGGGVLIPDRSWVSDKARGAWKKVKDGKDPGRTLDDIKHAPGVFHDTYHTPKDTSDDCKVHTPKSLELSGGEEDAEVYDAIDTVNRAYKVDLKDIGYNFGEMIGTSENFINNSIVTEGIDADVFKKELKYGALDLFSTFRIL